MTEVEFKYEDSIIVIQCTLNEKMKDIIERYKSKMDKNLDNTVFLYNGEIVKGDLSLEDQANNADKQRNKMCILVNKNNDIDNKEIHLNKSKTVICPQCQESIYMDIEDYKIKLHDCINGHKSEEILFSEFEKTQNIDESKIICQQCQNANKSTTFKNTFFRCLKCQKNICPLCRNVHDKDHKIINYNEKNYICKLHYDLYNSYCEECDKNICLLCEKDHKEHKVVSFGDFIPDKEKLTNDMKELRLIIDKIKNNINEMILKLNNFMDNLEIYYEISSNITKNYEFNNRNSFDLINILNINKFSNDLSKYLNDLIKYKNNSKFSDILKINDKMTSKTNKNIKNKNDFENRNKKELKIDKYENFNINNIKELISFDTNNLNLQIIILKDSRILLHNYPRYNRHIKIFSKNFPDPTLSIYSLENNNFNCDFIFETQRIYDMIEMDDGHVIIAQNDGIRIITIGEKEIIIEKKIRDNIFNLYKLSNDKFLSVLYEKTLQKSITILKIYPFKDGEIKDNYIIIIEKEDLDIYVVDENQVALSFIQKGIFGYNTFIIFYDIKNDKQIKSLKFDDLNNIDIFSLNSEYAILRKEEINTNKKVMILFNKKKYKIEEEILLDDLFYSLIPLNDKYFLTFDKKNRKINQYEFIMNNKNKIKLKEVKEIKDKDNIYSFGKYPGNKIYLEFSGNICIYG